MSGTDHRMLKAILALTIGSSSFAIQVFLPALPAVQKHFAVSAADVQLAVSLSLLAMALGTLFWGVLSDRFGRRSMLLAGLTMFFCGNMACVFAPSIEMLIAGRIFQGFGGAACTVISRAIVRDIYGREKAAAVMASLIAVMVLAPMLAPIVGGALVDLTGWRGNFAFITVFVAGVLALSAARLPETNARPIALPSAVSIARSYMRLMRSPDFMAYALQSAFMIAMFYVFLSAAPYAIITVMHYSATEYGLGFILSTVGYLAGNVAANRFSETWGIDRMINVSLVLAVGSTFAVFVLLELGAWNIWAVFAPVTVMGVANGMSLPNSNAGAVSVHPELAGTASGLLSFFQLSISAVFAQAAGSIQEGTPDALAIFMFLAAVLSVAAFLVPRRMFRRAAPSGLNDQREMP
jgi:DHA1 family bicyclomycin/chloramphenicol resistance-like MFS transporter